MKTNTRFQPGMLRIMACAQLRTSCRSLLKPLEIPLSVPCQCTLSLLNFIIKNQENFQTN